MIYYSPSRLSTYQQCPRHYKLKYVDGMQIPKEVEVSTFIGTSVHSALENFFTEEGKGSLRTISLSVIEESIGQIGEGIPPGIRTAARKYAEGSLALYERAGADYKGADPIRTKDGKVSTMPMSTSSWKEALRNEGLDIYKEVVDAQTKVGIADACAEIHSICAKYQKPDGIGRVLGVEVPISKMEGKTLLNPVKLPIGEAYLHGYIDMVCESPEGDLGVVDYKSGVTEYELEDLQWNPQLMLYSWAVEQIYGREVTWVGIHNLRHSLVKKAIDKAKRGIVLDAIWESIELIEVGIFPKKLMDSPYSICKKWYGKPCPFSSTCWPTNTD